MIGASNETRKLTERQIRVLLGALADQIDRASQSSLVKDLEDLEVLFLTCEEVTLTASGWDPQPTTNKKG